MPRLLRWSVANPDGNQQIKERGCLIRSLRENMYNAIKRPTKQHIYAIAN